MLNLNKNDLKELALVGYIPQNNDKYHQWVGYWVQKAIMYRAGKRKPNYYILEKREFIPKPNDCLIYTKVRFRTLNDLIIFIKKGII